MTVELPLVMSRPPHAAGEGRRELPRTISSAPAAGNSDLSGINVLIIDDQTDTRELLKRVLEEHHAQVIDALSVDDGLRALAAHRPHIVLCDIGMPGRDGYEFIREMRDKGDLTPAVAVTAFARPEDRRRALHAGYHDHITKPVEPSMLVAVVVALLGPSKGDHA